MFITAIALGFLGSLHCVVMCSPLAMAVTNLSKPILVNRLLYNGGRVLSYSLLGIMASSFGSLFQFNGLQNVLSVTIGCLLVLTALSGVEHIRIPLLTNGVQRMTGFIKKQFSSFLARKTQGSLIVLGFLNGLLPCGLTYLALTYCITLPNYTDGFFFMVVFGVGTLPAMLGLTSVIHLLIKRFNISFKKITLITTMMLGVLLIFHVFTHTLPNHDHEAHAVAPAEIIICR